MIAGSKNAGKLTTLITIALLLLSFVAIVIWARKKKSPDPKPALHTSKCQVQQGIACLAYREDSTHRWSCSAKVPYESTIALKNEKSEEVA
jgi:hypothetical protein